MVQLSLRDWKVLCDPEATRALYASMDRSPVASHCDTCENLTLVLDQERVFSREFREFLHATGIDPSKPTEAVETYQAREGWHHYSGFYFFAGEILAGPDSKDGLDGHNCAALERALTESLRCNLSTRLSFGDVPFSRIRSAVQIHWEDVLPWLHWDPPYSREPQSG
jgi:hypothetical protein